MFLATTALAAEKQDPLAELDAKITKSLAGDKWNHASKVFVREMWKDYRKAYTLSATEESVRSIAGELPDVEQYEDYLGAFGREADSNHPFLEITEDKAGRFHVKLEGHTIPAVLKNKTVVFTTGDVVYSRKPRLAEKPYCTLELFMVIQTEGKFFIASPSASPDQWTPLSKIKVQRDASNRMEHKNVTTDAQNKVRKISLEKTPS